MSKVMTMADAIRNLVVDGDMIYIAGFNHAIPFSAAHEIIRQRKRDLVLCRATPELIGDQMVASGCLRKVIFSWAGNGGVGLLRAFRRAVEGGQLAIEEYTHFGMNARLFAGASGLPFFPLRSNFGSDLPRYNPNIKTVTCPYTGEELSAVPALNPDVAIVHVQRADAEGNCHMWGVIGDQREAAFASRKVVVVAEEIVSPSVINSDPNRTLIPGFIVNAVVEDPWGAHPSFVQGYYDRDDAFYVQWDEVTKSEESLQAYLAEWVYGVTDRREYLGKLGAEKVFALTPKRCYSVPADYGLYS